MAILSHICVCSSRWVGCLLRTKSGREWQEILRRIDRTGGELARLTIRWHNWNCLILPLHGDTSAERDISDYNNLKSDKLSLSLHKYDIVL